MTNTQWEEAGGDGSVPAWNAGANFDLKVGDSVEGRLMDIKPNADKYNRTHYTLEKQDGSQVRVLGNKVIQGRMEGIAKGKMVKIVYKGEEKTKNFPTPFKNYGVYFGIDAIGDEDQYGK